MKKLILLIICMLCLAGCAKEETKPSESKNKTDEITSPTPTEVPKQVKIGMICIHDGYNFPDSFYTSALKQAAEELGIDEHQLVIKTYVSEDEFSYYDNIPSETYTAIKALVDSEVNLIITYGNREESIKQYAKEFPTVQFCILKTVSEKFEEMDNVHYAYVNIYEGKYLTGVVAGMKLNEMIANNEISESEALLGFVGGIDNVENEYTYKSFYLGAKSVCPSAEMKVLFTNSVYDETSEKEGAYKLIKDGCVILAQMGDSLGCPIVCETNGIPNIPTYPTINSCPNTYMCSAYIDWTNYFKYVYNCITTDKKIENWTDGINSIRLSKVNPKIEANGTQDKIEELIADIKNGRLIIDLTDTHITSGIERE